MALEIMKTFRIAFNLHEGDLSDLNDYECISGYLVFDVKPDENL